MPGRNGISWRQSQAQAAAAGSPPPPGGPGGFFRRATATPPPPDDDAHDWAPGPAPQLGYVYTVTQWPRMEDLNQSMDHGDMLSESQIQVSFEIQGLGEVYFGMQAKKRLGLGDSEWEMHGLTPDLGEKVYYAVFSLDFYHGFGTVVFLG